MREPREMVEEVEQRAELPQGAEERFSGYGVIGLTFASQHILCLRRWPISSLGQELYIRLASRSLRTVDFHSGCPATPGVHPLFREVLWNGFCSRK